MEHNRFFDVVSRINALLLLMLLVGGVILFSVLGFQSEQRQPGRTVEVSEHMNTQDSQKIELHMGNIQHVSGHDVHYVELQSKKPNRKFSSAYASHSQTRNILFFVGEEMQSHWLYDHHRQLVHSIINLQHDYSRNGKRPTLALLVKLTKEDTNKDGKLSEADEQSMALMHVDGTGYQEIETGIQHFIDHKVAEDGKTLVLLMQAGTKVIFKKYSLETFEKLAERVVTEVSIKI
ncbi:MAG: hypothetical protein OQK73_04800 [Gammaproteobacteria bacterium]|nr:hypothetical protein [Gammaproteobacteria bacterium]